jgi:acetyl esterase/lipase
MADFERMSLLGHLMPTVMRLRQANRHYQSRENLRRHTHELTVRPRPVAPPKRLRRGVAVTAAIEHGWRVYRITPTASAPRGSVVYLHGGGFIHEAVGTHWRWVQRLAVEASTTVLMPVYPLAHEGGTAAEVVPTVADLCTQAPGPVVLMGDSAGGTIAMAASLLLKQRQTAPALTVLISPALDLSLSNPQIDRVQPDDPWLAKEGLLEILETWAGGDFDNPLSNPIRGDLHDLAPLMIFSGTRDILNPDTRIFVERAIDADVPVRYTELPGHIHVFPLLPIREGRQAQKQMVTAVRRAVEAKNHLLSSQPAIGRYPARTKAAIRAAEDLVPPSGAVDELLQRFAERRGRPITVLEADFDASVSGMLIATQRADYIAVPSGASPERRSAIVCHEVAHMLLGHDHEDKKPLSQTLLDSGLLAGISEELAGSVVAARCSYMHPDEVDAEVIATYLAAELRRRVMRGGDTYYDARWR